MASLWEEHPGAGMFHPRELKPHEQASGRFGREPGKILAGQAAPDALVVVDAAAHPPFDWVYAYDLAQSLFPDKTSYVDRNGVAHENKAACTRLYTFARQGYLDSIVEWPKYKRFYRLLRPIEELRAAVAVKYLTHKYT